MKTVKMLLWGLLLIVLTMIAEFVVTIPVGSTGNETAEAMRTMLMWEFLLTALPAGLFTFFAAWILKLGSRKEALFHAGIWTSMYLLFLLLTTYGNQNMSLVFSTFSLYILLLLYFLGPIIYARFKKLT